MPGQASTNRNIRERIAGSVEGMMMFRGIIDGGAPRLLNAKVSAPFVYKSQFGSPNTLICVSAEIEQPLSGLLPTVRGVSFIVVRSPNGTEGYGPLDSNNNGVPAECNAAKFGPFPELQRLRTKRRQALDKPA
jgi:hypothetical protein